MTFQVRYLIVALVALTICVLYITRISLSVVIVSMTAENTGNSSSEFKYNVCSSGHVSNSSKGPSSATAPRYDWSQSTQGLILGSFFYPYVLMQVPAGLIADTFGGKWLICCALLASGLINLFTPLAASSPLFFVLLRIFLGIAQGAVYAAAFGLLHSWFPEAQRSSAYAMLGAGRIFGSIVSNAMAGALCEYGFAGGWPSVFYVSGLIGVAYFIIASLFLASKPSDHKWVSSTELSLINADRENMRPKRRPPVPWKQMITSIKVIVLIYTAFADAFTSQMISSKLPTYFSEILHVSPAQNGVINSLQYVAQFLMQFLAGPLSEMIIKKNLLTRTLTRKFFVTISYFGVGICMLLIPVFGCSEAEVIALMLIMNLLQGLGDAGGSGPVTGEMTHHFPAILFGLVNTFRMSTGFVTPSVAGWILDSGDDIMFQWKILFVTSGCITISGALLFAMFADATRQPWDIAQDEGQLLASSASLEADECSLSSKSLTDD